MPARTRLMVIRAGPWPLTGTWVCKKTGRRYGADRIWRDAAGQPCWRTLGVHVWAAYSPQRTWVSIVDEFEKAHRALQAGDVGPMTGFTNETLDETWELKGDSSDEHALQARAEDYPLGRVPAGALLLTAGVDVQRDRWEIAIWAWGRRLESWAVAHQVIQGNPASEGDWEPVTQYLQQRYVQAWHGGSLGLSVISIDSSDQTQVRLQLGAQRAGSAHRPARHQGRQQRQPQHRRPQQPARSQLPRPQDIARHQALAGGRGQRQRPAAGPARHRQTRPRLRAHQPEAAARMVRTAHRRAACAGQSQRQGCVPLGQAPPAQ